MNEDKVGEYPPPSGGGVSSLLWSTSGLLRDAPALASVHIFLHGSGRDLSVSRMSTSP